MNSLNSHLRNTVHLKTEFYLRRNQIEFANSNTGCLTSKGSCTAEVKENLNLGIWQDSYVPSFRTAMFPKC